MSSPETASLPVRMALVLGDLPAIGKTDKAPANMGGYSFRGIEAITAELKPLLAKHGVFVTPTTTERIESHRTLKSGSVMYVVDVHVLWTFYGLAGDTLSASTWGQGTDMGDKATQKAYTSAFKSMLAQVFCIADSETDSERHDVPQTERKNAGEAQDGNAPAPARPIPSGSSGSDSTRRLSGPPGTATSAGDTPADPLDRLSMDAVNKRVAALNDEQRALFLGAKRGFDPESFVKEALAWLDDLEKASA